MSRKIEISDTQLPTSNVDKKNPMNPIQVHQHPFFDLNQVHRHPAIVHRDAKYAAAKRSARLVGDGKEVVSRVPLATDLIGVRPLSLQEQVERFGGHGVVDWRLVPDEKFLSEDDFHDYLDDLPEEGLSPYELAGFRNQEALYNLGKTHVQPEEADDATPLPEGAAKRPHEAGVAAPDPSDKDGKVRTVPAP